MFNFNFQNELTFTNSFKIALINIFNLSLNVIARIIWIKCWELLQQNCLNYVYIG